MKKNIVLVGFMATGKTSAANALAEELNIKPVEIDKLIEEKEGKTIDEIFKEKGEVYFRQVEKEIVKQVSQKPYVPYAVISAGGGVVLDEENIRNLEKNGVLICLEAEPEVILERAKKETSRPLLKVENVMERIKKLLEKRMPFYRKIRLSINTTDLTVEQVVEEIKKIYSQNG